MGRGWSLLIGIGCLLGSGYTAQRALEFQRHGVVVAGTVVAVDAKLTSDENGFDYSERQQVSYIPEGSTKALTVSTNWSSGWLFTPKPGDTLAVRYLPDKPGDAREDSLLFDWFAPIILLFLAIGGFTGKLTWSDNSERVWWQRGSDD